MSELLRYAAIAATAHDADKGGSNADFIRGPNYIIRGWYGSLQNESRLEKEKLNTKT